MRKLTILKLILNYSFKHRPSIYKLLFIILRRPLIYLEASLVGISIFEINDLRRCSDYLLVVVFSSAYTPPIVLLFNGWSSEIHVLRRCSSRFRFLKYIHFFADIPLIYELQFLKYTSVCLPPTFWIFYGCSFWNMCLPPIFQLFSGFSFLNISLPSIFRLFECRSVSNP